MRNRILFLLAAVALSFLAYQYLANDEVAADDGQLTASDADELNTSNTSSAAVSASLQNLHPRQIPSLKPVKKSAPRPQASRRVAKKSHTAQAVPVRVPKQLPEMAPPAKTTAGKKRWVKDLSGERVGFAMGNRSRGQYDCNAYNCRPERPDSYTVVGVVMETERIENRAEPLMQGTVGMGDAQDRPLVHLK